MKTASRILGVLIIIIVSIIIFVSLANGRYGEVFPATMAILAALVLLLPVGIFYLRQKNRSVTIWYKIAFWLHWVALGILILGALPILGCFARLSCGGDGIGEAIVLSLVAIPAGIIYLAGVILIFTAKLKKQL